MAVSSNSVDDLEDSAVGLISDSSDDCIESSTTSELDTTSSSKSVSLLNCLRAPARSDLTRKRKIFRNPPHDGKRKHRPACVSNPKSVTPAQRSREFAYECLTVSAGTLFREACRQEVSLRSSIIKNHIASSKHKTMKERMKDRNERDEDIVKCLKQYDEEQHPSGEHLPEKQRLYRIKVVTAFLKAGVPLNKMEVFRDVFEEHGYRLACRRTMSDHIPFIRNQEIGLIEDEISGKKLLMVLLVSQRLLRVQLLVTGEEIARELVHTLSAEYSITGDHLVAAMRDRCSANGVAMRTIKVIFPDVLDVGCYSHTLDHIGEHFDTPYLEEFFRLWISLFSHSPRTRMEWKHDTGRAMASYSDTRWWSRWEVYKQVMMQFGDVLPFLEKHDGIAPATRKKLLEILSDSKKKAFLQIELATVVDAGECFVKATYDLEGNGPLVFKCYDQIQALKAGIENPHYPNVDVLAKKLSTRGRTCVQQYASKCVQPGLEYLTSKFFGGNTAELSVSLASFKAARIFVPHRMVEMQTDISLFNHFSIFNKPAVIENLKKELPAYISLAQDVSPTVETLSWWKGHEQDIPCWSKAVQDVALVQPSSAASERVFSVLKATFGAQQDCSLQDYIEASLLLQHNKH